MKSIPLILALSALMLPASAQTKDMDVEALWQKPIVITYTIPAQPSFWSRHQLAHKLFKPVGRPFLLCSKIVRVPVIREGWHVVTFEYDAFRTVALKADEHLQRYSVLCNIAGFGLQTAATLRNKN